MMKNNIFVLLMVIIGTITSYSQTIISGKITNQNNKPVEFANIYIKSTYEGTSSDENGSFSFKSTATGEHILVVSCIGYEEYQQKIELNKNNIEINITIKDELVNVNEVVISAGSFQASEEKRGTILKPVEISSMPGSDADISKALQMLPGTQTIGEKEGIFVRGGSGEETKILIDGLTVDNPYFSSLPDIPTRSRLQPDLFTGTNFHTGGYSALYGGALSSILSLKTADLADTTANTLGISVVGVSLSSCKKWSRQSLNVMADYSNLTPYFSILDQNTDWVKAPQNVNGSLLFRSRTKNNGVYKLYMVVGNQKLKLRYPDFRDPENKINFGLNNSNALVNSTYKRSLNSHLIVDFGGAVSKDVNKVNNLDTTLNSNEVFYQGRAMITRLIRKNNLKLGGEYQYKKSDGFYNSTNTFKEKYFASFGELNTYLTRRITSRIGIRTEYSYYSDEFKVSPRLSVAYSLSHTSQISGAYGHYYQLAEDSIMVDNKLKYQKAIVYILNFQWIKNYRTFRIEVYNKDYSRLAFFDAQNTGTYENTGYGYAKGIDVFWRDKKSINGFEYWITYSFIDTERKFGIIPTEHQPNFVAKHNMSILTKYWINPISTSVGLTYRYASGRNYYHMIPQTEDYDYDVTPDYHNVLLNIGTLGKIKGHSFIVYLSISNILNRKNVYGYIYDPQGNRVAEIVPETLRSYFMGILINF